MATVVLKLGNDISTDAIYPGRFLATVLPSETPAHAFADNEDFNRRLANGEIAKGSVILAGANFGCGSSREQAVSCLRGLELIVIARNFARIFLQNAVNLGLRAITAPDIEAEEGDDIVVSVDRVENRTTGRSYTVMPLSGSRQEIMDAGGLIPYTRKRLIDG